MGRKNWLKITQSNLEKVEICFVDVIEGQKKSTSWVDKCKQ